MLILVHFTTIFHHSPDVSECNSRRDLASASIASSSFAAVITINTTDTATPEAAAAEHRKHFHVVQRNNNGYNNTNSAPRSSLCKHAPNLI